MSKYSTYIFKQLLDERKKELKVFVMGAFAPYNSKEKLLGLRSNLRKEGYDARIAEDFEDEPKTDEEVFLFCRDYLLNWAHARILLFLEESIRESHIIGVDEESAIATFLLTQEEHYTCLILLEEGIENSFSSMTRGRLNHYKELNVHRFSTEKEMNDMAAGFCHNLMFRRGF